MTLAIDTDCIEWDRAKNAYGYGVLRVDGRVVMAHRVAYEETRGPIPSGMVIDHLCRNRACVNPDHMEVVTRGENVRRGRHVNRERTHCKRGHLLDHHIAKQRVCLECRRLTYRRRQEEAA